MIVAEYHKNTRDFYREFILHNWSRVSKHITMYYDNDTFLTTAIGNNAIDFEKRKKLWSDSILYVPQLIEWTIDDLKIDITHKAYEYVNEKGSIVSDHWLQNLIEFSSWDKNIYIIDNHNHAFYCRYKSYKAWLLPRWSHLIHIDQHSDLNEVSLLEEKQSIINENSTLEEVARYTNEVLDIASFIKPAKEIWLISDYKMILTEYQLLEFYNFRDLINFTTIIDIDLDFRAPEMGIEQYNQTISRVRNLISSPSVWCVTIATSPTYIDQQRALEILTDIVS